MMRPLHWLVAVFTLRVLLAPGLQGQAPDPNASSPASTILLPKDTLISLELAQDVNSQTARQDQPVELVVAQPVKVRDVVVAEVGSRAVGVVSSSVRPNFSGDPGELAIKLTFLKAGKTKVAIRGSKSESGEYRALIRGTQAVIPRGTSVKAYVEADTNVEVDAAAAAMYAQAGTPEDINKIRLLNGTPVQLLLTEPVSSKTAKIGDSVKLQVLEDVKVGDLVVIPARAPATGIITEAQAAGMAWHKGQLALRVEGVTLINQEQAPLELATNLAGHSTHAVQEWASVIYFTEGLAIFALPFAPLQHGNQALLRRGTVLEAFTQHEMILDADRVQSLQPRLPVVQGPASVTFYFPEFENAGSHKISIGETKLGDLKAGRKVTCKIRAGRYSLHLGKQAPAKIVDLREGTEYYVRVGFIQISPREPGSGFTVVPHDVGEMETLDMRPAEWKSIPDTMNLKAESEEKPPAK